MNRITITTHNDQMVHNRLPTFKPTILYLGVWTKKIKGNKKITDNKRQSRAKKWYNLIYDNV